jgi:hypothetical protein
MTAIATLALTTAPRLIASAFLPLVVVQNTGSIPVRVVTEGADNGRTIAPGATVELESHNRFANLSLVADAPTSVEAAFYDVASLRADAAAYSGVPVEFITGRSKAEIAQSVVHFKGTAAS